MSENNSTELRPPIFIGGFFKSGTTLLRVMLGRHTNIFGTLETYWFDWPWFTDAVGGSRARGQVVNASEDEIKHFLISAFEILEADVEYALRNSSGPESMLEKLFSLATRANGKCRWVEKTPGNILYSERINNYWPESKIIHIRRNPLDVFASNRRSSRRGRENISFFCSLWEDYMISAQQARQMLPKASFLEISYENLVTDPTATMKEVVAFVGESWELGLDEFNGDSVDYHKLLKLTGVANTTLDVVRMPLMTDRQNAWKSQLTPQLVKSLEAEIAERGLLEIWTQFKE